MSVKLTSLTPFYIVLVAVSCPLRSFEGAIRIHWIPSTRPPSSQASDKQRDGNAHQDQARCWHLMGSDDQKSTQSEHDGQDDEKQKPGDARAHKGG